MLKEAAGTVSQHVQFGYMCTACWVPSGRSNYFDIRSPCFYTFCTIEELLALFFVVRSGVREMGTPEARNLTSVRCGFIIYLFLGGGEK